MTPPPFSARLVGQTEHRLATILDRQLAGTGLTRSGWMTLAVLAAANPTIDREHLAASLPMDDAGAQASIDALVAAGLAQGTHRPTITITAAGRNVHRRISDAIGEITRGLWADLPAADLATTASVLHTVIARADDVLARDGADRIDARPAESRPTWAPADSSRSPTG